VTLTEAGQTFLQHCQRLQDGREEALRAVGDLTSEPKGMLRMTCAVAYGERFIVPLVTRFMGLYPQLRVDIELSNRQLDLVHEGLDLAIRLGACRTRDWSPPAWRPAHVPVRVAFLPGALWPAPQFVGVEPAQLPDRQFRLWQLQQDGREFSQRVQGNWRCNSGQAVLDAALQG
jgi:DNA-binding transcriptional LysR family regulator